MATRTLYKCSACSAATPSPGRLEGNWCPSCGEVGTLEYAPQGEAADLTRALGVDRRDMPSGGVMQAVSRAREIVPEADRAALELLADPKLVAVLFFLEEEQDYVPIIDVFRACRFRMKTHAYRAMLDLAKENLVEREGEEWRISARGKTLLEEIRNVGM